MAKKAVRIKADVHELNLQTADDVALAIKEIGDLERERVRLATLQADEKAVIDEKYTAKLTALKDKVKPLQKAVQAYCESRRDVLTNGGKQKTAYFPTGEVQWRVKPPAVVAKGLESILDSLRKLGLFRFIRTKEELDKEAMLKEPEIARSISGISIREGVEEFVIKPNDEEVRK
ncbi:host-nuclease inhibitor protein Gam [[Haemophilus] ducreyi]|uniref:Mu-phage host-nuclease inhibitor protein n=2 Tax=Haemophilus ducreyi TaxID=730 RepID=Q7VLD4_HAEDU|nr:host-nuclease inhibitor Gam family protein [[Haemophilus] ducreyi]AAP96314.1 Putative mu-phage host-nuclease inhibitor protein [[Haemophilus] ducreyi 35000HP]AKO31248.1 host-nuclease inhibitor protein Gam [[Haemophilus] ducreyi]AKO32696.1 host-nuclease inhibitor protein Gam [[Haemophilus] ducreyi]AKO34145.1 host-nuclease inhibitor protein Gam [[Haemophilus] ducreyi]AKO35588.1 host-nuclease inhibitor protein Gam [[Haemophilus] ducreyi]